MDEEGEATKRFKSDSGSAVAVSSSGTSTDPSTPTLTVSVISDVGGKRERCIKPIRYSITTEKVITLKDLLDYVEPRLPPSHLPYHGHRIISTLYYKGSVVDEVDPSVTLTSYVNLRSKINVNKGNSEVTVTRSVKCACSVDNVVTGDALPDDSSEDQALIMSVHPHISSDHINHALKLHKGDVEKAIAALSDDYASIVRSYNLLELSSFPPSSSMVLRDTDPIHPLLHHPVLSECRQLLRQSPQQYFDRVSSFVKQDQHNLQFTNPSLYFCTNLADSHGSNMVKLLLCEPSGERSSAKDVLAAQKKSAVFSIGGLPYFLRKAEERIKEEIKEMEKRTGTKAHISTGHRKEQERALAFKMMEVSLRGGNVKIGGGSGINISGEGRGSSSAGMTEVVTLTKKEDASISHIMSIYEGLSRETVVRVYIQAGRSVERCCELLLGHLEEEPEVIDLSQS